MDGIADLITRIRNGQNARLEDVNVLHSKFNIAVLNVLKEEGYIADYGLTGDDKKKEIVVVLKYSGEQPVIKNIQKVSKPGRRVYTPIKSLESYYNGLGIMILSTPKGVIADHKARELNVGGEVLCKVF